MDSGAPHDFVAAARALIPLLEAEAPAIEAAGELTPAALDAMHRARLFRMLLPAELDGGALPLSRVVEAVEAVAMGDASAAWCLGQAMGCSMSAGYLRPEVAREIFGPPRAVMAWGQPRQVEIAPEGGGHRASGRWNFASGCHHATWIGALCLASRHDRSQQPRIILFPRERATFSAEWRVMGLRGTGTDGYAIHDLLIPEGYSFVRESPADRHHPGTLYRFTLGACFSSVFAGVALGIARAVLDSFETLAQGKTATGRAGALREAGVVQLQVAQCEARLRSARLYLLTSLDEAWAATERAGEVAREHRLAIRLAGSHASLEAREVVDLCYQAAGATAIFQANPFERRFRDMHAVSQQVQAHLVHFETVGQMLLGLDPDLRGM